MTPVILNESHLDLLKGIKEHAAKWFEFGKAYGNVFDEKSFEPQVIFLIHSVERLTEVLDCVSYNVERISQRYTFEHAAGILLRSKFPELISLYYLKIKMDELANSYKKKDGTEAIRVANKQRRKEFKNEFKLYELENLKSILKYSEARYKEIIDEQISINSEIPLSIRKKNIRISQHNEYVKIYHRQEFTHLIKSYNKRKRKLTLNFKHKKGKFPDWHSTSHLIKEISRMSDLLPSDTENQKKEMRAFTHIYDLFKLYSQYEHSGWVLNVMKGNQVTLQINSILESISYYIHGIEAGMKLIIWFLATEKRNDAVDDALFVDIRNQFDELVNDYKKLKLLRV